MSLGVLVGAAVAYAITGRHYDFIQWTADQPYENWPIVGWSLLGGVVGAGLFLIGTLMSGQDQQSHKTLGAHPQTGRDISLATIGDQNVISDGEISVSVPTDIPPSDVTLGLAAKLLQNRGRSSKSLQENEVDVRFVRRWGSTASETKVAFSQVYSLAELRYCRDQFVRGLKSQGTDWNVAVRGLLEWAKEPNANMWYSVDLSLAAVALRAFPDISGRGRCIVWFDRDGRVTATLIKQDSTAATVQLGALPVRDA